jgi:hypothetical protein
VRIKIESLSEIVKAICLMKEPLREGFLIRGKKVVFQLLASTGDSGIGKKFN